MRNLMHLTVKETKEDIYAVRRVSKHISPHLHHALEIVCVTEGALELGVGQELYHMEKGDIGFVFSDIIHHYQVFTGGVNKADYILIPPSAIGLFADKIQNGAPQCPVVCAEQIGPDVYYAMNEIMQIRETEPMIVQAYVQIILAGCMGILRLVEKSSVGSDDLIYRTVSYISANFQKHLSLEKMARDLGVSKYVLSRVFSGTFHQNFNQYLNEARLSHACAKLENTNDTILAICLDSGFESQRTFNRVFRERYNISPSEYRRNRKDNLGVVSFDEWRR